ncbi:MAG: hypothetical protein P4L82_12220 [Ancalomicrobiaceae bacterium]|nr:hypothetical protein [Ancalomicrobiaceae bacterium]
MSLDLSFAALQPEYDRLFATMVVRPSAKGEVDAMARAVLGAKARCQVGERLTGAHWVRIALQQMREAGTDDKGRIRFDRHPHNGDTLAKRTTHDPAGRPGKGSPPFTWEESWVDAADEAKLIGIGDWSVARLAWTCERTNGWGYRERGIGNPYLWAGTLHYVRGKYVKDHEFDPDFVDRQIGVMPVIARLMQIDPSICFGALIETGKPGLKHTAAAMPVAAAVAGGGAMATASIATLAALGAFGGQTTALLLVPIIAAAGRAAYDFARHHLNLASLARG